MTHCIIPCMYINHVICWLTFAMWNWSGNLNWN